jgi:hypothetical protein
MFKQINLDVYLSPTSSETVQLRVPRELNEDHKQIGSIQYGGVKYPITHGSHLKLKYVELRLESEFLKEIKVFNMLHELIGERDANGWLKYKFTYADDEIKLAKRIAAIISKGMEREFGISYLTCGLDEDIHTLPRPKPTAVKQYNQTEAIRIISDLLINKGYNVSRSALNHPAYHLIAENEERVAKILVRHLQYDHAYDLSALPYQVYKIDAFETVDEQKIGVNEIDFVVGYNFKDNSFASLEIKHFKDKKSRVVHQKEGLKAEFYNSWHALDEYLKEKQITKG